MTYFRISIEVDAVSRDEAAAFFKQQIEALEKNDWKNTFFAGGGGGVGGTSYSVSVGPRPLSVQEQIIQLEKRFDEQSRQARVVAA